MTRLSTVLRRQIRPIRDTDRFSLTPAGIAALDAGGSAHEHNDSAHAENALRGAQEAAEAYSSPSCPATDDTKGK